MAVNDDFTYKLPGDRSAVPSPSVVPSVKPDISTVPAHIPNPIPGGSNFSYPVPVGIQALQNAGNAFQSNIHPRYDLLQSTSQDVTPASTPSTTPAMRVTPTPVIPGMPSYTSPSGIPSVPSATNLANTDPSSLLRNVETPDVTNSNTSPVPGLPHAARQFYLNEGGFIGDKNNPPKIMTNDTLNTLYGSGSSTGKNDVEQLMTSIHAATANPTIGNIMAANVALKGLRTLYGGETSTAQVGLTKAQTAEEQRKTGASATTFPESLQAIEANKLYGSGKSAPGTAYMEAVRDILKDPNLITRADKEWALSVLKETHGQNMGELGATRFQMPGQATGNHETTIGNNIPHYGEGQRLQGPDGKEYVVHNGVPVLR